MKRRFDAIAQMVKTNRVKAGISQSTLSQKLGFKNGQFISNLERGLCPIPNTSVEALSVEIKTPIEVIIDAMVEDYKSNIRILMKGERRTPARMLKTSVTSLSDQP